MPAKACQRFYNDFTMFSALPVLFNMYTDKDSNLISELEYGSLMNQLKLKCTIFKLKGKAF